MTSVQYIPPRLEALRHQPGSMFCCFQFEEKKPLSGVAGLIDWRLLGQLSKLRISHFFSGKAGETLLVLPGSRIPVDYVVFAGAGSASEFSKDRFAFLLGEMVHCALKLQARSIVVSLPGRNEAIVTGEEAVNWFFELCPPLLPPSMDLQFSIMDDFDTQVVISQQAEQYRMRNSIPIENVETLP